MSDRLLEVKIAYHLNMVSKFINQKKREETIKLLSCLLTTVNESWKDDFNELIVKSINDNILGATKKEIYVMLNKYYKKRGLMAKKAGYKNPKSFTHAYSEYHNKPITDDYLESLTPVFITDSNKREMCLLISKFFDDFYYLVGEPYFQYYKHPRTVELEFWLIYKTLTELYQNAALTDKFIFNMTTIFDIEWATISFLARHILDITRNSAFKNSTQFRQEVFNLFYAKGFTISEISNNVFKTDINYYSDGYKRSTKNILNSPFEFAITYVPTLDWTYLNLDEALKFINIFDNVVSNNG